MGRAAAKTVSVAYEDAHDNFERRVKHLLAKMGSKDPDADIARMGDYVSRARDAGLDPQVVANTIYLNDHHPHAAADNRLPPGEYAIDPKGLDKLHDQLNSGQAAGSWGAEERPSRPGYYAVDPTGKIVAGPFESRHQADRHASHVHGYVQFEAGEQHVVGAAETGAACPGPSDEKLCGCVHGEPLQKPLRWHRGAGESGGYYADCPLGKFTIEAQRSNRRQGVLAQALRLDAVEIRSFDSVGDAKAYAQAYGTFVPAAANGQAVAMDRPGKMDARPVVGGKAIAESCAPWVRVTRDPAAFQSCLVLAQKVGPIDDGKKVFEILSPYLAGEDQEVFLVVMTDIRDQLRGIAEVARGQRDKVLVDPADILRPVIITGASRFYCAHNHPSGNPDPSGKDKALTRQIAAATKTAAPDVEFRGHVVVGAKSYRMA